jgi:hypothetical protein
MSLATRLGVEKAVILHVGDLAMRHGGNRAFVEQAPQARGNDTSDRLSAPDPTASGSRRGRIWLFHSFPRPLLVQPTDFMYFFCLRTGVNNSEISARNSEISANSLP